MATSSRTHDRPTDNNVRCRPGAIRVTLGPRRHAVLTAMHSAFGYCDHSDFEPEHESALPTAGACVASAAPTVDKALTEQPQCVPLRPPAGGSCRVIGSNTDRKAASRVSISLTVAYATAAAAVAKPLIVLVTSAGGVVD